jgi:hypothetical protein
VKPGSVATPNSLNAVEAITDAINCLLTDPLSQCGRIYNEHGLQIELGMALRSIGMAVEFERPFSIRHKAADRKKPKKELDILVTSGGRRIAVELKTPLAGRVPESLFDFCADLEFLEELKSAGHADHGLAVLLTDNRQFWNGDAYGIYAAFRSADFALKGRIEKPTGAKDTAVVLAGCYSPHALWQDVRNRNAMHGGRVLMIEV